jgi:hypothetical protein
MSLPNCEEIYDRFVRNLESQHKGAFAAVHSDGRVLIDKNDIAVVDGTLKQFGPGTFVPIKIGSRGVGKWRRLWRL